MRSRSGRAYVVIHVHCPLLLARDDVDGAKLGHDVSCALPTPVSSFMHQLVLEDTGGYKADLNECSR